MPKWEPGKKNGTPVAVEYFLPVLFRLEHNDGIKKTFPAIDLPNNKNVLREISMVLSGDIRKTPKNSVEIEPPKPEVTNPEKSTRIYQHVEVMPRFPDGDKAMMDWIAANIQYPKSALEQGIHGRVIVRFVVTPDGSIDRITVQRSLDPACDREALRVLRKMPKWLPGKQNGKPVSVYYTMPVLFRLPMILDYNRTEKDNTGTEKDTIITEKHLEKRLIRNSII
jgi:protein TonB